MNHKLWSRLLFSGLLLFAISGCQSQTDSNSSEKTTLSVPANSGPNQSNARKKVARPQTIRFASEVAVEIGGAAYGSSPAIIYAAENPKVKAVALHSPGINYF